MTTQSQCIDRDNCGLFSRSINCDWVVMDCYTYYKYIYFIKIGKQLIYRYLLLAFIHMIF